MIIERLGVIGASVIAPVKILVNVMGRDVGKELCKTGLLRLLKKDGAVTENCLRVKSDIAQIIDVVNALCELIAEIKSNQLLQEQTNVVGGESGKALHSGNRR